MQSSSWDNGEKPLNTVYFDSSSHSDTLLLGLNTLRVNGYLLDVTLYAENKGFQAHRAVLASCSDYFRAMFTDAMLESKQSEIRLNGVTAEGISLLLDYAYTSRLGLNLANIQDVLSAASHFQVIAVVEACSSYLESQLDTDNCVDIATLADTYSLSQLGNKVYRYISSHLKEFSSSKEFYRLSAQQLERLLNCDYPVDCGEADVLRIVIRWLRYHHDIGLKQRLSYSNRFLRQVHLSELTQLELDSTMHKAFAGAGRQDEQLYHHIMRECQLIGTRTKPVQQQPKIHNLINSRGMELAIVKVGGFNVNGVTNEITYFLPSNGKWSKLTAIPHLEQCNYGTTVLNNELYVVGGCFNQGQHENVHPFGFRYSPLSNKWMNIEPMQRERCRFSLNVVGEHLYAVGGASEMELEIGGEGVEASETIASVEKYHPATDTWESMSFVKVYTNSRQGPTMGESRDNGFPLSTILAHLHCFLCLCNVPRTLVGFRPMSTPRAQHSGCAWPPSSPDRLIISGGLYQDVVLSTMRYYHTSTDSWESMRSMLTPRADHAMVAIAEEIYVCGGWCEDAGSGARVLADTIDAFHVREDSWRVVTTVPTPRYNAGIIAVGSKIYFIGGFHSDATFDRATASIECYDVDTDVWTTVESYPQEVWEHSCVNLYIPKCLDDNELATDKEEMSYSFVFM